MHDSITTNNSENTFFFLTVGDRKKEISFLHWSWKQANVGREHQDPFATVSEMSTEEMDSGEKEKNDPQDIT